MMSAALCNAGSPLPMRQEFLMFKAEKDLTQLILYVLYNRATTEEELLTHGQW